MSDLAALERRVRELEDLRAVEQWMPRTHAGLERAQRGTDIVEVYADLPAVSIDDAVQAALALPYEGTVSVMVPSVNGEAMELLQHYGFEQVRTNRHMGKGIDSPPGQRQKIYAQTSLAVG